MVTILGKIDGTIDAGFPRMMEPKDRPECDFFHFQVEKLEALNSQYNVAFVHYGVVPNIESKFERKSTSGRLYRDLPFPQNSH